METGAWGWSFFAIVGGDGLVSLEKTALSGAGTERRALTSGGVAYGSSKADGEEHRCCGIGEDAVGNCDGGYEGRHLGFQGCFVYLYDY